MLADTYGKLGRLGKLFKSQVIAKTIILKKSFQNLKYIMMYKFNTLRTNIWDSSAMLLQDIPKALFSVEDYKMNFYPL